MKILIPGGGGRVGSNTAYALQLWGLGREIVLLDANQDAAEGEALDLVHGTSSAPADQTIRAGTYADAPTSDIIIITAGSRRKPDESRLDLVARNTALFRGILGDIRNAGLKQSAVVLVVSNPVDLLTRVAVESLCPPLSPGQVIGLGTVLDSLRLRGLIAAHGNLPATQVQAMMLGEHGDSMVAAWSAAQCGGAPITSMPGMNPATLETLEKRARGSGAEVIRKKGGAGYAVGVAIADVVRAVVQDLGRVLPVSTRQTGVYGVKDVCYSIPTVVGRAGATKQIAMELWPKEQAGLVRSGEVLANAWKELQSLKK